MSKRIISNIIEFRNAINDSHNWFTVLKVTAFVIERLTTEDYDNMSRHGMIIWKVNT